ncbi:unnamed protein product [Plutella xylostella]|uniref:(diamondback moth) hypothetical protein n=1 Tax=Plutella xylostella TaxID=51655 RepID=A0A8S4G352_PLUXY|nr:unnamed protein product [Plutella xylostella]
MKVFRAVNSPEDSALLQDDLNKLNTYCRVNSTHGDAPGRGGEVRGGGHQQGTFIVRKKLNRLRRGALSRVDATQIMCFRRPGRPGAPRCDHDLHVSARSFKGKVEDPRGTNLLFAVNSTKIIKIQHSTASLESQESQEKPETTTRIEKPGKEVTVWYCCDEHLERESFETSYFSTVAAAQEALDKHTAASAARDNQSVTGSSAFSEHWDILIIHMVTSKLDSHTMRDWETERNHIKSIPTLEEFNSFLKNRADLLETMEEAQSQKHTRRHSDISHNRPKTFVAKILLQNLWAKNVDWNSQLPAEVESQWNTFVKHLPEVTEIQIPRRVLCDFYIKYELVHIELVTDLTSQGYMAMLNRLICRRGKPASITSDNAKCFIGTFNELPKFLKQNSNNIINEAAKIQIEFKFSPPYSPHFNGLAEASVKSVKHHLKRVLSMTHLDYEEMYTVMVQIEAILNSRPITPISSDPSDLVALTPAHFLIGRTLTMLPAPQVDNAPINTLSRYKRVQALKAHFWNRYYKEYISALQIRSKWHTNRGQLQLGQMVLIKDDRLPPNRWLLGRITAVYPGTDGINRVADVLSTSGTLRRAYNRLCPLPMTLDQDTPAPRGPAC